MAQAPTLASASKPRLVVTASPVHDPTSGGGNVGSTATLGDLSGLAAGARFEMVDGGKYDPDKAYKDSKLCNMLFCREAQKQWAGLKVRSFSPGFIPASGLFREPRKDNFFGAQAFTLFAGLAGFAVPIDVGGRRLAFVATASDADVPPGSYLSWMFSIRRLPALLMLTSVGAGGSTSSRSLPASAALGAVSSLEAEVATTVTRQPK